MADPLSLLRQYNIHRKEIVEKDEHISFDEFSFSRTAKTNYIIYRYAIIIYKLFNIRQREGDYLVWVLLSICQATTCVVDVTVGISVFRQVLHFYALILSNSSPWQRLSKAEFILTYITCIQYISYIHYIQLTVFMNHGPWKCQVWTDVELVSNTLCWLAVDICTLYGVKYEGWGETPPSPWVTYKTKGWGH